jgi:phosphotransferase system enzyme I (PtsI)
LTTWPPTGRGIGLFRSEFIFLDKNKFPDEEEQLRIYAHVLKKSHGPPVVIRTLDVGGDKMSILHQDYHEANPFSAGVPSAFCLTMPDIFKTQLRALYRASVHGALSIMLPMISGMDECSRPNG